MNSNKILENRFTNFSVKIQNKVINKITTHGNAENLRHKNFSKFAYSVNCTIERNTNNSKVILKKNTFQAIIFFDATQNNTERVTETRISTKGRNDPPERNDQKTR